MNSKMDQLVKVVINLPGINHIAPKWVGLQTQYLAFRAALTSAYMTCARHYYPKWASYFMDKEFQPCGAAFLSECYQNGVQPEPAELANIWANHMKWLSEEMKQRHIAELVPVASRFLRCLDAELHLLAETQPIFEADRLVHQKGFLELAK